jgi:hypothetical protein
VVTFDYDTTLPTATWSSTVSTTTSQFPFEVTLTFSEVVINLLPSDIRIHGVGGNADQLVAKDTGGTFVDYATYTGYVTLKCRRCKLGEKI